MQKTLPPIQYPEDLPVSGRRDEIRDALLAHPVIIVCGETGSGKTTQLPKICLEAGRGQKGLIGHTQPRRLAATSVARRIAQELQTQVGEVVGWQVRFNERFSPGASIKLMTDGILLAETQRDPMLRRYDTLIIDEAHERSLNIDFLMGYLFRLLPKRPDLKLIITSATIDAERFSKHFSMGGKPAPVIEVSGRLYPVEVRWRPVDTAEWRVNEESDLAEGPPGEGRPSVVDRRPVADRRPPPERRGSSGGGSGAGRGDRPNERLSRDAERDLMQAISDAVDECARSGPGDVLVFLPGEREIREAAEVLRKHHPPGTQILPLYARLTNEEQERVFRPTGQGRRVVLATNVAETSLTVPGIRFVVDSGLARVKRYSWRSKVEQLRVEPISRASANQRAGRCGRVGPGICIRLFDEADFQQRAAFTDPEILRSSLAAVILRMKSLGLDDIESFPFVEPPTGRAVADGYTLLQEIGALDDANALTEIGRTLARLPIDPRMARMILAAREQQCLREMLIIAAALSVQDPRERPLESQQAADQAHARFADDKSEFLAWVKLWDWYHEQVAHKASNRKLQEQLRREFLSPLRLREWHDVHVQLHALVAEQGWRLNETPATVEQVHRALLTGLIGQIGLKHEEDPVYLAPRGVRFQIHPSSKLARKAGRWIVAAELMETTRLFARCVGKVEPEWIEKAGAHLIKKQWSDPFWDRRSNQVQAHERGTLHGLPIYSGRRINFSRIDPQQARAVFIREALVAGQIDTRLPFLAHNLKLVREIEVLEHKARRPDILVDDTLIEAFYDQHLPAEVCHTRALEDWYAKASRATPKLLFLKKDELMRHEAAGVTTDVFPKTLDWLGTPLALSYHFEPGSPRDGVTATVPLLLLRQLDAERCEWLVPGLLKEKVQALVKSLPQKLRRHCVPLPEYAAGFHDRHFEEAQKPQRSLIDALIADLREQLGLQVQTLDFKPDMLAAHLFMNFRVVDEHGRMLAGGRNLAQLKAELGEQAAQSFQKAAAADPVRSEALPEEPLTDWTFGELPELLEIRRKGVQAFGYPALVDRGTHCEIDVFDDPSEARRVHERGLLRLFRLQLREPVKFLERNLPDLNKSAMFYLPLGTQEELRDQIIDRGLQLACLADPWPATEAQFRARVQEGRTRLSLLAQEVARLVATILQEWNAAQKRLAGVKAHEAAWRDMNDQLQRLLDKRFIARHAQSQLQHFPRYLKGVQARIDKLRNDPARDARLMAEWQPLWQRYERALQQRRGEADAALDEYRWLLEELRVALYAQELRTPTPVSVKRLQKVWETLQR